MIAALLLALALPPLGANEVLLTDGVYRITHPVTLGPRASGLRLVGTGKTVITGARVWEGLCFAPLANGVWRSAAKRPFAPDGLIVGGRPMRMARYPNDGYGPIAKARIDRWANPCGAIWHMKHHCLWGDVQYRIIGRKPDGSLDRRGGGQINRVTRDNPAYQWIENVREELDAPGEWYYDAAKGELLVYPYPDQDLRTAEVEYTCLSTLFDVVGATNVVFSGIRFTGTRRTMFETTERMFLSDWKLARSAAITFTGALNCRVTNCDFTDLGGNALFFGGFNDGNAVSDCLFRDIGASGVIFAGEASCVRSPRFDYELVSPADFAALDPLPGPRSEAYPRRCTVDDCLFTCTGNAERQSAPVTIFAASAITVRDCTIFKVPRAGINIGTGAFGGHLIQGCDVFDTVLETGDHGAFNSWGRDRFWQPVLEDIEAQAAGGTPTPDVLDAVRPTVIRGNRWRCDHGWDIDLDDGSSNYVIEDNVLLSGGIKLREGYRRVVRGNYVLNNGLHAHCWLRDSGDVVTNNVFFAPLATAGRMIHWGEAIAPNTLATPANIPPMPVRPFGVRSPRLKAIAHSSKVPAVRFPPLRKGVRPFVWRGMNVRAFDGPIEFSAFGVTPDMHGYVIVSNAVPPFVAGDLVLGATLPDTSAASCTVIRRQSRRDILLPQ